MSGNGEGKDGSGATPYPRALVTGAVLAGGRARRMGGEDKGLVPLGGEPMVARVIAALRPQVATVLINANRNAARYREIGRCEVLGDEVEGYAGPLAGMATVLRAAATPFVLTVPCDSPLVAADLGARLHAALSAAGAELAVAHDGERLQPVFALLRRELLDSLLDFLGAGERKIDRWYATRRMACADLSDRPETFENVNTPLERAALERRIEAARA